VRKKIISIGLMLVMSISLFGGCTRNRIVYTDYFRVQLRRSDGYAVVLELTELGKEQEILAVPMFVERLPVRQIGRELRGMWGGIEGLYSPNLIKLYLPYTVSHVIDWGIASEHIVEIIVMSMELPKRFFHFAWRDFYVVHYDYIHSCDTVRYISPSRPNVAFRYNYSNSPNQGYYWFDYVTGSNLYLTPPPTRQGYVFDGWYLDPQGTTPWDNQMPTTAEENLRLYARWQRV